MFPKLLALLFLGETLLASPVTNLEESDFVAFENALRQTTNETDSLLALLNNNCRLSSCPDHGNLELWSRKWEPKPGSVTWDYFIRIGDCGQCLGAGISSEGCADFLSCGRRQNVCIDWGRNRGHRIWKDNGHKTCYHVATEYMCNGDTWAAWFDYEVPCNW